MKSGSKIEARGMNAVWIRRDPERFDSKAQHVTLERNRTGKRDLSAREGDDVISDRMKSTDFLGYCFGHESKVNQMRSNQLVGTLHRR